MKRILLLLFFLFYISIMAYAGAYYYVDSSGTVHTDTFQAINDTTTIKNDTVIRGNLVVEGEGNFENFVSSTNVVCSSITVSNLADIEKLTVNSVVDLPNQSVQGSDIINNEITSTQLADNIICSTGTFSLKLTVNGVIDFPNNSIDGADIKDNEVTSEELANTIELDSITVNTSISVPSQSLDGADIKNNEITSTQLADEVIVDTITANVSVDFPSQSIQGSDIINNEITSTQLADEVTVSSITINNSILNTDKINIIPSNDMDNYISFQTLSDISEITTVPSNSQLILNSGKILGLYAESYIDIIPSGSGLSSGFLRFTVVNDSPTITSYGGNSIIIEDAIEADNVTVSSITITELASIINADINVGIVDDLISDNIQTSSATVNDLLETNSLTATGTINFPNNSLDGADIKDNEVTSEELADDIVVATLDTGQGANELYDMDQNVTTTSSVQFSTMTLVGNLDMSNNNINNVGTITANNFIGLASTTTYALDSDKWDGYQFADYLDQAVKTDSDVQHSTITINSLNVNNVIDLPADSIQGADIKNNEITSEELADDIVVATTTITTDLIVSGNISLPAQSLDGADIKNNEITSTQLADDIVVTTLNTGQGANELYDMDQNVTTTSSVQFSTMTLIGDLDMSNNNINNVETITANNFTGLASTTTYALDSDKWDGYQFADYLNQAVKTTSNVQHSTITINSLNVNNVIDFPNNSLDGADIKDNEVTSEELADSLEVSNIDYKAISNQIKIFDTDSADANDYYRIDHNNNKLAINFYDDSGASYSGEFALSQAGVLSISTMTSANNDIINIQGGIFTVGDNVSYNYLDGDGDMAVESEIYVGQKGYFGSGVRILDGAHYWIGTDNEYSIGLTLHEFRVAVGSSVGTEANVAFKINNSTDCIVINDLYVYGGSNFDAIISTNVVINGSADINDLTVNNTIDFPSQSLDGADIKNNEITSTQLADEVIVDTITVNTSISLPAQSLDGADIKDNEITSTQLADAIVVDTLDTGQGVNELYDMDQDVLTTSSVQFSTTTLIGDLDMSNNNINNVETITANNFTGLASTTTYALDSDKWDGYQFADYLDQDVKTTADVQHSTITVTNSLIVDTNTLYVNPITNFVGISTNSPSYSLDVAGDINTDSNIYVQSSGIKGKMYGDADGFHILSQLNTNLYLAIDNGWGITIQDGTGNVGINDTTPSYKLDVNGDAIIRDTFTVTGAIDFLAQSLDGADIKDNEITSTQLADSVEVSNIDYKAVSNQIKIYDTDSSDANDYYRIDHNNNKLSINFWDDSGASYSGTFSLSHEGLLTISSITFQDGTQITSTSTFQGADADLDDLADGTLSKTKVQDYANWDAAYTHISNDGSDHSFIDQSVVINSSPTFYNANMSGNISVWTNDSGYLTSNDNLGNHIATTTLNMNNYTIENGSTATFTLVNADNFTGLASTATYALNSDKWDGYQFSDYLDQDVKTTADITFSTATISNDLIVQGNLDVTDTTILRDNTIVVGNFSIRDSSAPNTTIYMVNDSTNQYLDIVGTGVGSGYDSTLRLDMKDDISSSRPRIYSTSSTHIRIHDALILAGNDGTSDAIIKSEPNKRLTIQADTDDLVLQATSTYDILCDLDSDSVLALNTSATRYFNDDPTNGGIIAYPELYVDSKLGVNTNTPDEALDINGAAIIRDTFTVTATIDFPAQSLDGADIKNNEITSTQLADDIVVATLDTGQGANELYDMDQNVLTTSEVTFATGTFTNDLTVNNDLSVGGVLYALDGSDSIDYMDGGGDVYVGNELEVDSTALFNGYVYFMNNQVIFYDSVEASFGNGRDYSIVYDNSSNELWFTRGYDASIDNVAFKVDNSTNCTVVNNLTVGGNLTTSGTIDFPAQSLDGADIKNNEITSTQLADSLEVSNIDYKAISNQIKIYDTDSTDANDYYRINHNNNKLAINFYDDSGASYSGELSLGHDAKVRINDILKLNPNLDPSSSPDEAGYIGVDSSYNVYMSTGTGSGAWRRLRWSDE